MTPETLTIGMFGLLLLGIMAGVSISFILGGMAVVFTLIINGTPGLFTIIASTFDGIWSILLTAVPLFIFMGVALARSTIASDLYEAFYLWFGRVNGGLLIGTAGFAAVLSSMTGNCAASTLTTGMVGIPAMDRHGYDRKFVLGTIGAAGTLGVLLPPSITLILIGLTTGISVGTLFMGGLVAGVLLLILMMLYVAIRAWLQPASAPSTGQRIPLRHKIATLRSVVAPLVIIVAVLASIFMAIATPTEAAAVGAVTVVLTVACRGEVNRQFLREVTYTTATMTGMVMWIVFGASAFVSVYSGAGGVEFVQGLLFDLDINPWTLVLLMQLITLIVGMFMDPAGLILLVLPIFFPVVTALGFDPVWFAIIFQLNLCIGYITPPFGYNIFYLKSLSSNTPTLAVYQSLLPYVLLMIGFGLLLMIFPKLLLAPIDFFLAD